MGAISFPGRFRQLGATPPTPPTPPTPATSPAARPGAKRHLRLVIHAAPAPVSPARFGLQAALVLALAGGVALLGRGGPPPRPADEPAGSVTPAATAAEPQDAADPDDAPPGPTTPTLPAHHEVRWDAERRALIVTDIFSREELPLGAYDVSRVRDAGGATVTLELWGGEASLEVPRDVYAKLPARERHDMDYGASGNVPVGPDEPR